MTRLRLSFKSSVTKSNRISQKTRGGYFENEFYLYSMTLPMALWLHPKVRFLLLSFPPTLSPLLLRHSGAPIATQRRLYYLPTLFPLIRIPDFIRLPQLHLNPLGTYHPSFHGDQRDQHTQRSRDP